MNKYKFGDKVTHETLGIGFYSRGFNLPSTEISQVIFENAGCRNVLTESLKPVSAWIACSERMPEFSGCYLTTMIDTSSGEKYQVISHFNHTGFAVSFDEIPTHWQHLPTPPQD